MNIRKIYTLNYLQRIVNAIGGVAILLIVSHFYDIQRADQFYAVFSLLGLVAFYEFGYAILIVQRFSFYSQGTFKNNENLINDIKHYFNIISIFSIILLITFPLIANAILGYEQFTFSFFLAFLLAVNLQFSMAFNILEGLGLLEYVARIRAYQAITSYFSIILALAFGFGYYSVFFLVVSQSVIMIPSCCFLYKEFLGVNLGKDIFGYVLKFRRIYQNKFKEDCRYSFQLYLSALSMIFGNQVWIVALSIIGVENISKYAITLQIITACSGFALTPIVSRLSQLAKSNHIKDDKSKRDLISHIVRDIIKASLVSIFGVCFLYGLMYIYMPGRVMEVIPSLMMVLCIPIIVYVSVIGVIIQSKGKGDMVFVSLSRIIIPALIFVFMGKNDSQTNIASYFLVFNFISMILASYYLVKELK
ncbi:hypothetical protein [Vibrio tasmaniensis]|uniref:hypothetical protein n=1 Tax=Vibrio tasmaniensis TaxID=212663 RepID=UPI0010820031|nr:hypothetical protein [Vibrio tasmaniensis]